MRNLWVAALLLASASLLLGQLDSNSITITASRPIDLRPDQVIFNITIQSGPSTTDAQGQARKLADAAGLSVGQIVALSDGSSTQVADVTAATFEPLSRFLGISGFFLPVQRFLTSPQFTAPAPSVYCSITVKFQLLRYQ